MATCLTNSVVYFLLSVQTSFVHTSSQESRRAVDIHDLPDLLGRLISRRFPPLHGITQAGLCPDHCAVSETESLKVEAGPEMPVKGSGSPANYRRPIRALSAA